MKTLKVTMLVVLSALSLNFTNSAFAQERGSRQNGNTNGKSGSSNQQSGGSGNQQNQNQQKKNNVKNNKRKITSQYVVNNLACGFEGAIEGGTLKL